MIRINYKLIRRDQFISGVYGVNISISYRLKLYKKFMEKTAIHGDHGRTFVHGVNGGNNFSGSQWEKIFLNVLH